MKNFGFSELVLVNPRCETRNVDAYKGAKHAKDILEKARVAASLDEAAEGCDIIVGTTGIRVRNKGTIRGVLPLRAFASKKKYYSGKSIALVFGREGIGLTEDELNKCDLLVHVETSPHYPVLNISHAAAIILHSISGFRSCQKEKRASARELRALNMFMEKISSKFERKNLRAPVALKRVLSRAHANEHEVKALLNLFRMVSEMLEKQ